MCIYFNKIKLAKMKRNLFGLLVLLSSLALFGQKNKESITDELNTKKLILIEKNRIKDSLTDELNNIYKQGYINGFSVAIVNQNKTLYQKGIGFSDKKNKKVYTENTIQNIASISKTFIGIALLKAQELGKLDLDDPINKFLPFEVKNPYYQDIPITIRHLATHTSTIMDTDYYDGKSYILKDKQSISNNKLVELNEKFNSPDSHISMINYLNNVLTTNSKWYKKEGFLKNKPGEIFNYSNVGATLAAAILEKATGEKFDKFTTKYILNPLGMLDSGWSFEDIDFSKHSKLYSSPDTELPFYCLITYPDGGFITSVNDLSKYLTELIKGYSGKGIILKKESYKELFKEQLKADNFTHRETEGFDDEYNTGIFMGFSPNGYVGHTGGDPGVSSFMFFNPKSKLGRIVIINTDIGDEGYKQFAAIWNVLGKYESKMNSEELWK